MQDAHPSSSSSQPGPSTDLTARARGSKRAPELPTGELQDRAEESEEPSQPRGGVKREAEVDIRDIDDRVPPPGEGSLIGAER